MALITQGTQATLTATTVEGQLWQWLMWTQSQEDNATINPLGFNRITGTKDIDSKLFRGNWSLPAIQVIQGNGELLTTGTNYLSGATFSPGDPAGTFKGANWAVYGLEIIRKAIDLANLSTNAQIKNNVTANFNLNSNEFSGTFSLPFEIVNFTEVPKEYL